MSYQPPSSSNQGSGFNFALFLTALQNLVQAVSGWSQTQLNINGTANVNSISAATLIKKGSGRLCSVTVVTAGSAVGAIYDASDSTSTSGQIYTVPMTVGTSVVNMPVSLGIVVAPGTSQVIAVSYS